MARRSPFFEFLEYGGFRLFGGLAAALPHAGVKRLGESLGSLAWLVGIRRGVTMDNLRRSFPEKSESERHRIAHGAFRSYGIAVAEMFWSARAGIEALRKVITPVNLEVLQEAHAQGHGVILLSGHFGSWELSVTALTHYLPAPMTVIAQTQRNKRVDRFMTEGRERFGNRMVSMTNAPREVLKTLSHGGIVFLLADQSGARESPYALYFGRPAATHRGPAVFSLKSGAPIVFVLFVRKADGNYEARFERVDMSGLYGSTEEQVRELTQRHVSMLEKYVREHPDHWLWMHKRWKHTAYYEAHEHQV
jgi:Kdo2-lipid IVA lauroyltransferase/acyltransferase